MVETACFETTTFQTRFPQCVASKRLHLLFYCLVLHASFNLKHDEITTIRAKAAYVVSAGHVAMLSIEFCVEDGLRPVERERRQRGKFY
jgi:hypothetical protein